MTYGNCDVCRESKNEIHSFPRDMPRARYWAKLLNWEQEFEKVIRRKKELRNINLCQKHFSDEAYHLDDAGKRTRLKRASNPMDVRFLQKKTIPRPVGENIFVKNEPNTDRFNRLPCIPSKSTTVTVLAAPVKPTLGEFFDATEKEIDAPLLLSLENLRSLVKFMGCSKCGDHSGERSMKKEGAIAVVTMDCPKCGIVQWCSSKAVKGEV